MADELIDEAAAAPLASFVSVLPHALSLNIFARLPVDTRARCMAVCPAWGVTLADPSLWTRVDLSASSGVTCTVNDAALYGASGLARGGLTALDISGRAHFSDETLLDVFTANAGALRELSVSEVQTDAYNTAYVAAAHVLEPLLAAAPSLSSFNVAKLDCFSAESLSLLRNEPPFGPLRVRCVCVSFDDGNNDAARFTAVLAVVAEHASMTALELERAKLGTPAAIDAVADVVLTRRFKSLMLYGCDMSAVCVPSLARLVRDGALTKLSIREFDQELVLLEAPSASLLCDALRANTTLTSLHLGFSMWTDAAISAALLGALTAHPSLRDLSCSDWYFEDWGVAGPTIGAALGALVAANAPTLQSLSLTYTRIVDAGLGPMLDALAGNTHLTELDIRGNNMTEDCVRDVLLPAVRSNVGLRSLRMENAWDSACEAMALVTCRVPR
jgi:hypothetical protein